MKTHEHLGLSAGVHVDFEAVTASVKRKLFVAFSMVYLFFSGCSNGRLSFLVISELFKFSKFCFFNGFPSFCTVLCFRAGVVDR